MSVNTDLITKPCCVVLEYPKFPLDLTSEKMDSEKEFETPRKSKRSRNKPNKFGDFLELTSLRQKRLNSEASESEDELSDGDEEMCLQKPTALFSNDDVKGQDMFMFKSRHMKTDLQNKVKSAIMSSPKTDSPMKTPRRSIKAKASPFTKVTEATPKHVKNIMKKRIIKQVESESDYSDFSASSSDFVPDSEKESESESSSKESETMDEDTKVQQKQTPARTKRETRLKPKDTEYIVAPDTYFMMNSSKKITTSDHTLERLKNFSLNDNMEQCDQILLSEEHKKCVAELTDSYTSLFDRWMYVLSEDFNIVLYGVGSKRAVLHRFVQEKLQNYPCVVVNGFFPSLTIKSVLESIVIDLLELPHVPSHIGDVVSLINTELTENDVELFLVIHNIDGSMLRNSKTQSILASISQIKNVHTIATIDHINAPLLWDHTKLSKFNFTWWDVTTFLPYSEETSFENSLMSQRSGALQLSSLRSVYLSLTSNAKGIFNIIIKHQLDNHKQAHYQGLPFRDLYSKCREQFLVSSDVALRAQLTEFLDHKLVKMKRTHDGGENLIIPIDNTLLQQFLEQQNS